MGPNRFPVDLPNLVDFYLRDRRELDAMISQRITEGFEAMRHGELARSVIVFDP
jgi:S-(hydroxymethyl)glutathione dehydrogenase / alcohol dehydrogenase